MYAAVPCATTGLWPALDGAVATPSEDSSDANELATRGDTEQTARYTRRMAAPTTDDLLAAIRRLPLEERLRLIDQSAHEVAEDTVVRDNGTAFSITFAETAPPGRGSSLSLRDSVFAGSGQNHGGYLVRLGDHRDVTGR